ncbi:hypothetical protein OSB04_003053 [Centaurea solstitialis]|uniref:Retrotransposon Copia-like N-terminal domain-containing protein n=1 Tax=Centaurea solstitialis TaxID=347529 RepID=A0AA38UBH8_9ASTR|nr:hypothetical protein OSB04_003053 [Centaurea solstitialis]
MAEDGKIDPTSPFYLGSGDQPGNLITHVILKGDNYLAWARAITLSLKARRKFEFVNGTISKPSDKKNLINWETVNSMLVSWMLRSMEPKVATSIPFHDEAKPLWDYLEKRFCVANGPRLQQLRADIIECKQTKSMSIEDYYNRLMGKFTSDREEEKLHQFLIGVDDDLYAMVRTILLSQHPVTHLRIYRAYQAFQQEERSCGIARGKAVREEANVFAIQTDRWKGKFERQDKSKLFCSHCKKFGHDDV